jgi:electron transfer flavoprotein alpha subunit
MTECIGLDVDDERRLLAERLTYGGSCVAKEMSRKKPHIATIPPRTFQKPVPSKRAGEVIKLDLEVPASRIAIVERKEKLRGEGGLEEAPIIVAAGRGFREKKDLQLLEELSDVLGAKVGCTRPIAADSGWLDEWIGISGLKVGPRLYIACGISGTVQHAAGIRDAQIIVSINKDEAANIFELSDYGVVGDLYKVLPALTKALKSRRK